jgi:putative oxidoreductase
MICSAVLAADRPVDCRHPRIVLVVPRFLGGTSMNRPLPLPARDWALLFARVVVGVVMFAHGYQKLVIDGIGRTTAGFERMSIPVAIASASYVTVVEFVAGALLVAGALTTIACGLMLVHMVGAAVLVHIPNGIFVTDNGWELVGVIAAALVTFAAVGPGRFSLDHVISARQQRLESELERHFAGRDVTSPATGGPTAGG